MKKEKCGLFESILGDNETVQKKLDEGQREMLQEMIDEGISVYYLDESGRDICENKRGKFFQIVEKTIKGEVDHNEEDQFYYKEGILFCENQFGIFQQV